MADVIEMIQLSPTMEEGILVEWLVKEGDTIVSGDLLAEVETDKAAMEMESYYEGTILKLLIDEGAGAGVGTPIAIVGDDDENIDDLLEELKNAGSTTPDTSSTEDDEPAETPNTQQTNDPAASPSQPAQSAQREHGRIFSSPVARKLAADEGIDLGLVHGSGPNGRIIKRDIEQAIQDGVGAMATGASAPISSTTTGRGDQDIPLTPMRKSIAKNLTQAWQAPAFMLTRTVTMDRTLDFRKRLNEQRNEDEPKVSVNDIIIKACAAALMDHPEMNASFGGEHVTQYEHADIGFAVAIDGGLITPIIRQTQSLGLRNIASQTRELAARARKKKLKPEEFSGATFSVSNLGMFGIEHFTAVLNPPGAGILAVGTIEKRPIYNDNDELVPKQRMTFTLTCDHRVVDGAIGAEFLQTLAVYLEDPTMMIA